MQFALVFRSHTIAKNVSIRYSKNYQTLQVHTLHVRHITRTFCLGKQYTKDPFRILRNSNIILYNIFY